MLSFSNFGELSTLVILRSSRQQQMYTIQFKADRADIDLSQIYWYLCLCYPVCNNMKSYCLRHHNVEKHAGDDL